MERFLPELAIQCPRCGQPHRARSVDGADQTEWIVECGDQRAHIFSPLATEGPIDPAQVERVIRSAGTA